MPSYEREPSLTERTDIDQPPAPARPVSPFAGKPADPSLLVNIPRLVAAYYSERPDPSRPEQRVSFGTSGHRGSSFTCRFNESHVLAIAQAICRYRRRQGIDGPLFLGIDTHALSEPAYRSALEVLAANDVAVQIAVNDEYTPTPAVSHAILAYNRGRTSGLADGIVITPSHNPPDDGGFKYNPPHGGPAGADVTGFIESAGQRACWASGLAAVRRVAYERALRALDHASPRLPEHLRRRSRQRRGYRRDPRRRPQAGRGSAGRGRRALLGARSPSDTA